MHEQSRCSKESMEYTYDDFAENTGLALFICLGCRIQSTVMVR